VTLVRGVAAIAVALFSCVSCDRDAPQPPPPAPQAPVASIAKALGIDASEIEPSVDPPAAAGDLQAEIAAFTTVDACVEQRAHLDPLLGDALEAIGYDTFVRDACRILDAAKAGDAKRCDAIDASSLRRQCIATVAAIAGNPDACPWLVAARPALGRDAWCLAVATRDPRLCAAAETSGARATCVATVRRDAAACAKLPVRADQLRCRRDSERWRTAAPGADAGDLPAAAEAEGTLRIEGGDAAAPVEANLAPDLARGIVLLDQRDGARFDVGAVEGTGPSFVASSPHTQATLGVELFASADGKVVTVERADLRMPGRAAVGTPLARSTLVAKIDKLDHARGGAVALSLDGDLGDSSGTWHIHATVKTFVRDVVSAKAIYGAAPLGFGDAGMMR
jgi:hypothetical protein